MSEITSACPGRSERWPNTPSARDSTSGAPPSCAAVAVVGISSTAATLAERYDIRNYRDHVRNSDMPVRGVRPVTAIASDAHHCLLDGEARGEGPCGGRILATLYHVNIHYPTLRMNSNMYDII